jgi:hypothetical protein
MAAAWREGRQGPAQTTENRLTDLSFVVQSLCMNDTQRAAEHLLVIRSLMEKATVYRALSAPSALVGGLLSLAAAGFLIFAEIYFGYVSRSAFFTVWLAVLGFTAAANAFFLRRDALQRGDPFVSPGMKLALRAIAPPLLAAAFLTGFAWRDFGGYLPVVLLWMVAYALALLATQTFAPASIATLGWGFLLTGFVRIFLATENIHLGSSPLMDACISMGGTFGLYHVLYAIFAWPQTRD